MPLEFTKESLFKARRVARERFAAVAIEETPAAIRYIVTRLRLGGRAFGDHIEAPRPLTRKALYIYLHEIAHVIRGHCDTKCRKPRHLREYEAEKWAHDKMHAHGIAVPRKMTSRAGSYVRRKIRRAQARSAKNIDRQAQVFARMTEKDKQRNRSRHENSR